MKNIFKIILLVFIAIFSYSQDSLAITKDGILTKEDIQIIDDYTNKNGFSYSRGYHIYKDWRFGTKTEDVAPKAGFVLLEEDTCSFLPKSEIKAKTELNNQLPQTTGIKNIPDIGIVKKGNKITADTVKDPIYRSLTSDGQEIENYDWQLNIFDENWERQNSIIINKKMPKYDITDEIETLMNEFENEGFNNFGLYLNVQAGDLSKFLAGANNHSINGNHRVLTNNYIVVDSKGTYKNKKVGYGASDVHPKEIIAYSGWAFNAVRFTVESKLEDDLELVSITGGEYQPGEKVTIPVKVKSNFEKEKIDSVVTFESEIEGVKEIPVTLEPGESKTIYFNITIPKEDNKSWKIRADINKKRNMPEKEITFDNNSKISMVKTPDKPIVPKPLACPSTYDWIEEEIRMEPRTYCSTDGDGNSSCSTIMVPVTYYFGYNATLTSKQIIKDDKETQSSNTKINLKSGYGFKVDLEGKLVIKQTSGPWTRQHTKSVQMPTIVKVTTSWEVKQINNIGKETNLELVSTNVGVNGGIFKYSTPTNPNSENNRRVIYTDLNLKGNRDNHVDHKFITSTTGKVGSQSLCNDLIGNITIVGNMYEDYRVN